MQAVITSDPTTEAVRGSEKEDCEKIILANNIAFFSLKS